jgi:hypothetical protein
MAHGARSWLRYCPAVGQQAHRWSSTARPSRSRATAREAWTRQSSRARARGSPEATRRRAPPVRKAYQSARRVVYRRTGKRSDGEDRNVCARLGRTDTALRLCRSHWGATRSPEGCSRTAYGPRPDAVNFSGAGEPGLAIAFAHKLAPVPLSDVCFASITACCPSAAPVPGDLDSSRPRLAPDWHQIDRRGSYVSACSRRNRCECWWALSDSNTRPTD